ncbi:MAG TPA: hypothetical protein VIV55_07615 [Flavobacterium sp.]
MSKKTPIFAATMISALLLCSCQGKKKEEKIEEKILASTSVTAVINPPIPELDIPYQNFTVTPDSATVLTTPRGTKIRIPSNAFLDKDGNVIKDKVDITFREFHTPLDFYLAGIPMTYDENGIEKVFESGGMVEINATSNKNEVFVNPENKIKVDMLSWTKSTEFNAYDLDKTTGKWIDKGKDFIRISKKEEELNALPPIPPIPKVATHSSFKIEVDEDLHPEIAIYENVYFEPIDMSKCKVDNAHNYKIKPLKNGIYEVTSILYLNLSSKQEIKCECYLAFEKGKDYNEALKTYQKKYASLIKKRQSVTDQIIKEWNEYDAIINESSRKELKSLDNKEKIVRTLEINNFGFVNCDQPINYPSGGEFNPIYVDEKEKSLQLNEVVLVEKNTNTLFRYTSTVKYDPKNKNVLWGITNDGKIAYIRGDDFKNISAVSSKQTIKMHVVQEKPETYEDIKKILF